MNGRHSLVTQQWILYIHIIFRWSLCLGVVIFALIVRLFCWQALGKGENPKGVCSLPVSMSASRDGVLVMVGKPGSDPLFQGLSAYSKYQTSLRYMRTVATTGRWHGWCEVWWIYLSLSLSLSFVIYLSHPSLTHTLCHIISAMEATDTSINMPCGRDEVLRKAA